VDCHRRSGFLQE